MRWIKGKRLKKKMQKKMVIRVVGPECGGGRGRSATLPIWYFVENVRATWVSYIARNAASLWVSEGCKCSACYKELCAVVWGEQRPEGRGDVEGTKD